MTSAHMEIALSPEKQWVQLKVGDAAFNLTADLVSDLINRLMFARAEMQPPLDVQTPPKNMEVSVHTAHWAFGYQHATDNNLLMVLPHRGYGWIAYRFALPDAERLSRALSAQIQQRRPGKGKAH